MDKKEHEEAIAAIMNAMVNADAMVVIASVDGDTFTYRRGKDWQVLGLVEAERALLRMHVLNRDLERGKAEKNE